MKIQLLCENEASDMVWLAEWGFSVFIEYQGTNILFDTGFSDVYVHNARHAGIDLEEADFIAISHFHRDLLYHPFKKKKNLVLHPRVLSAVLKTEDSSIKNDYAQIHQVMDRDFEVITSDGSFEMAPGAFFLGEIPRSTQFESGKFEDDPMIDDTALAFKTDKGAVVISGCSHAGICNICEHAKSVTGQELHAVLGGFHLLAAENPPIDETIAYFQDQAPEILLPMHCVDFPTLARFHNVFGSPKYGAGSVIEL